MCPLGKIRNSVRCGAIQGVPTEQLIQHITYVTCETANMTRMPFKR